MSRISLFRQHGFRRVGMYPEHIGLYNLHFKYRLNERIHASHTGLNSQNDIENIFNSLSIANNLLC